MNHTFLRQIKTGVPLGGGLRKQCFLVKAKNKKLVYSFWPKGSLPSDKIREIIKLELLVKKRGLPTRRWIKPGRDWIKKVKFEGKDYWLGIGEYLPGRYYQRWSDNQFFAAGQMLAKLHWCFVRGGGQTLLHLDFARGNVLFSGKDKVVGILDFEESDWGEVEKDLGCSLSFLVIDNSQLKAAEIWEKFLRGYTDGGGQFIYDKIKKHFRKFLKERMKEKTKEAFLFLARKRLADYHCQIKARILTRKDLAAFSRQHRKEKIVFVVGAFELLHWGHLEFMEKAKALGDLLVVGVASDDSRRRLKGKPYPLISDRTRAETLVYYKAVDGVVVVAEDDVEKELKDLRPQIFCTVKQDWEKGVRKPKEAELIKSWQGNINRVDYFGPRIPSSVMVEKVALVKIRQILFGKAKRQPLLKPKRQKENPQIISFEDLERLEGKIHRQKKTIAFTSLTADLFHLGHARFIQKAKSVADILVVGVPSNRSVTALKGLGRPIIDEYARALVLTKLEAVDWVVIFDERTILGCLQKVKPDVFFTVKEDWNTDLLSSPEARFMKSIGGKIIRSERQAPYLSASKMIDKAAGELIQKKFNELLKAAKETPVLDADRDGFDPHSVASQLAAREKGFYEKVLAAVAERGKCVFCDLKEKYVIAEKDKMVLTVALYPYIDGHLLIIPRRHLELLKELNEKEQEAIFYLSQRGKEVLTKGLGIENYWLLLREGKGIRAGKTVEHLHFHLIPYDPRVIKMIDTPLKITPLKMAQKLKGTSGHSKTPRTVAGRSRPKRREKP